MKQSLLFTAAEETEASENLIADFMLDRSFGKIIADVNKRRYFLGIVAAPLMNAENIIYRREILRDFIARANLLPGLKHAFGMFSVLKEDQQRERTKLCSIARTNDSDAAFANAMSIAQISSLTCKRILLFLREIRDNLHIYEPLSQGLRSLSARIDQLTGGDAFDRLIELCTCFDHLDAKDIYDIHNKLNESARISEYELFGIESFVKSPEITGIKKLFAPKTKPETNPGEIKFTDLYEKLRSELLSGAIVKAGDLFSKIAKNLFDEFGGLSKELEFYETALLYYEAMRKKNIPSCFPEINTDRKTHIESLYDLLLCMTQLNAYSIVPNDVCIEPDTKGILIRGENNSGKTVFLRSVGTAQLLAQAGLPIPAKTASVSVMNGISTQFAASEKEFTSGNEAGRFEQEVRELSAMIDNNKPDSLVLLNETFQTTAYNEGAEGLYHILNYLSARGVKWILVTHLHELFDRFAENEIMKMASDKGANKYKFVRYV
ncbi:MAG: MutS-related protein [Eubacteriales bacterium]